jgi:hypothetical protein
MRIASRYSSMAPLKFLNNWYALPRKNRAYITIKPQEKTLRRSISLPWHRMD